MEVTVKGISTISYDQEQPFFCSADNSRNYTWEEDGIEQEGRRGGTEKFSFHYHYPKRVFIECKDSDNTILARYTVIVCANDSSQQKLLLTAMSMIPIVFSILIAFQVALVFVQGKWWPRKDLYDVNGKMTHESSGNDSKVSTLIIWNSFLLSDRSRRFVNNGPKTYRTVFWRSSTKYEDLFCLVSIENYFCSSA